MLLASDFRLGGAAMSPNENARFLTSLVDAAAEHLRTELHSEEISIGNPPRAGIVIGMACTDRSSYSRA